MCSLWNDIDLKGFLITNLTIDNNTKLSGKNFMLTWANEFFYQIVILSPAVLLILTGKMGGVVVASEYGPIGSCCYWAVCE